MSSENSRCHLLKNALPLGAGEGASEEAEAEDDDGSEEAIREWRLDASSASCLQPACSDSERASSYSHSQLRVQAAECKNVGDI